MRHRKIICISRAEHNAAMVKNPLTEQGKHASRCAFQPDGVILMDGGIGDSFVTVRFRVQNRANVLASPTNDTLR